MPPRTALLYSETLLNTAAPVSLTRSVKVSRRCSEVMVSRSKSVVDQNKKKNIHSGVYSVYSIYYYYCSGTVRNHYPLSIFNIWQGRPYKVLNLNKQGWGVAVPLILQSYLYIKQAKGWNSIDLLLIRIKSFEIQTQFYCSYDSGDECLSPAITRK